MGTEQGGQHFRLGADLMGLGPSLPLLLCWAVHQASCSMDFRLGLRGDSTGQGLGSDLLPTWQQALAP